MLRLLKQGVFDFAAALPIYVEDGGAIIEAVDIAGVARSFKMSREITDAWMPEMQKVMKERHGAMILATFTWPEQNFYCRGDIKSVEDLKGKKIRVQGTSQADLAKALRRLRRDDRLRRGGAGAREGRGRLRHHRHHAGLQGEVARGDQHAVPPAGRLHRRHLGRQPQRAGTSCRRTRARSWRSSSRRSRTSPGRRSRPRPRKASPARPARAVLPGGPPGKLKLVKPSEADLKARDKALNDVVLKGWAKRCGDACAAKWTELVGKKYGLAAKAN